jgi:hypothetical protein
MADYNFKIYYTTQTETNYLTKKISFYSPPESFPYELQVRYTEMEKWFESLSKLVMSFEEYMKQKEELIRELTQERKKTLEMARKIDPLGMYFF